MGKKWYLSKTIDMNVIFLALVGILVEGFGFPVEPTIVVGLQAFMNVILRKYFTREPIV